MFDWFSAHDASPAERRRLLRGAALLIGALVVLWLVLWLLPNGTPPPTASDAAGTVAARTQGADLSLLTPGRILVVLLLAGGAGFALYLRRRPDASAASPSPLQPVGHLPLAQDQQLKLVRCQDEVLLLGVTAQSITLLRTYAQGDFDAAPLPSGDGADSARASLSDFAHLLRQYTQSAPHA